MISLSMALSTCSPKKQNEWVMVWVPLVCFQKEEDDFLMVCFQKGEGRKR
jgi:hypothetical protein